MINIYNRSNFVQTIKEIEGKMIWNIKAGEGTGSIFTFQVGDKILHPKIKSHHQGEYSFMIYCGWRIIKNGLVITGWREDSSNDGPMVKGLMTLAGQTITKINVADSFDFEIHYGKDKLLNVFCDLTKNQRLDTNWFFRKGEIYFSINNNLSLEVENLPQ